MEQGLEIQGVTAIEDKLQDGVSDALNCLRKAGTKVWKCGMSRFENCRPSNMQTGHAQRRCLPASPQLERHRAKPRTIKKERQVSKAAKESTHNPLHSHGFRRSWPHTPESTSPVETLCF